MFVVLLYGCGVANRLSKKKVTKRINHPSALDTLMIMKRGAVTDSLAITKKMAHRLLYGVPGKTSTVSPPYKISPENGAKSVVMIEKGVASWYGPGFNGLLTANGEIYNMHKMTAAHRTLPFNTMVLVQNIENGKSVVVRINDRGPFVGGRIIDLSKKAARKLGMLDPGTAKVRLYVAKGTVSPPDSINLTIPTYTIQLGSFANQDNAYNLSRKVKGSRVEIVQINNHFRYRVYYGLYSSMKSAIEDQKRLEQKHPTCFIQQIESFEMK